MIVSFDLDRTATEHSELAQLATSLQATGHQTYILTGRKSNAGIREMIQSLGFPNETSILTKEGHNGTISAFKSEKLQEIGADIHIDDQELNLPFWHPTKVLTFQKSRLRFGRLNG